MSERQRMATADVTIMGAGVIGLSVALACTRLGARVQVIDPSGPGAGASGGLVGALAPHVPENWNEKKAFQFESLCMAEAFWTLVKDLSGQDPGYARLGRLQPLADDNAITLARSRQNGAMTLWQGRARWDIVPAHGDWAPPSPSGMMIHDTLTARLHPQKTTRALAEAVRALGGTISKTGSKEGKLVWATGWQGLEELSRAHNRSIGTGVKGQAALLELDAASAPQLFIDGIHIVPHLDGTVAVGSTSERYFTSPHGNDDQLETLIEKARMVFPPLRDAPVIARWAGVRPRSRSRAPMLGQHPFEKDAFVANGGFKIGFGMAPKIGEVMAQLIVENHDTIPNGFRVTDNL